MGVRIIRDTQEDMSCIYDSVTDTAFGPVFYDSEEAEEFLEWFWKTRETSNDDPRKHNDDELQGLVQEWRSEKADG